MTGAVTLRRTVQSLRSAPAAASRKGGRGVVALDARYVRERPSGIGAMVEHIAREVPALLPDVDFVLLKHPQAPGRLCERPGVREVVVRAEANGPATLFALSRLVDLDDVDLFHAPHNILPLDLAMPAVVTVHDVLWLSRPELCRAPGPWGYVQTAFFQVGLRAALRSAERILCPSEATRREIVALRPDAEPRIAVVPHGVGLAFRPVESDEERAADEAARARHLPPGARYVLGVGQAAGYKNHTSLVEAFRRAFPAGEDVHLVLVQRLGHEAAIERFAREPGLAGRVHLLRAVPHEDLVALYRGALALGHPSWHEGWGMPITEAMGCGCPVIASSRSAMVEIAGDAALLVDPGSIPSIAGALRTVADDADLRRAMSERGLERVRALSWQAHARRTADVYREILDGPRSHRRPAGAVAASRAG